MTGRRSLTAVLIAGLALMPAAARSQGKNFRNRNSSPINPTVTWAKRVQQGFNMRIWLSNQMEMGRMAWLDGGVLPPEPCAPDGIGLEYPAGSCVEHLFGAGPWIGGIVDGVRRVVEGYNGNTGASELIPVHYDSTHDRIWRSSALDSLYDMNFSPPRLLMQTANRRFYDDDHDGRIDEDDLDGLDNDGDWNPLTDDVGADGLVDSLELSCTGRAYDPVTNPDPAHDNFDPVMVDVCHQLPSGSFPKQDDRGQYTEKNGIPDHGEPHVDEDYGSVSDNDYYLSATDTFKSTPPPHGLVPVGIKVIQKSYAWGPNTIESPILPFDYCFVNIGQKVIRDVYIGFFCDMDVGPVATSGYWMHDYAGYIPDIHTAYIHNPVDRGSTPLGLSILHTSRPLDSLRFLFWWSDFEINGFPFSDDSMLYSWMTCEAFGFRNCIAPDQSFTNLSDTRFFISFGPFGDMNPGDSVKVSVAFVSGNGVEAVPGSMRASAIEANVLYGRGFIPPIHPGSPPLHLTSGKKRVTLDWKSKSGSSPDPEEAWDDHDRYVNGLPPSHWRRVNPPAGHSTGGRIFDGYRVWRSEDPGADPPESSFTLLAQYGVRDEAGGARHAPLVHSYVDSNLTVGKRYWYAVTAYTIPDIAISHYADSAGHIRTDTLIGDSYESPLRANRLWVPVGLGSSTRLGDAKVVPNPYRTNATFTGASPFEGSSLIWFIDLPAKATIRIYTLVGEIVATIEHNDALKGANTPLGQEEFPLKGENGSALASGVYIYTVESDFGKQIGKFVIIK